MTGEELINYISFRKLNGKTNNMIIKGDMVDGIPNTSLVSFIDNNLDTNTIYNVKIDLSSVSVRDILTYVLEYLKDAMVIDPYFDYTLPFENKFAILKFVGVLNRFNIIVSLIFENVEVLDEEEQMLFNELYYFNSIRYNVISFVKDHFKTYYLSGNRVLDDRENYERIEIFKTHIKTIEEQ